MKTLKLRKKIEYNKEIKICKCTFNGYYVFHDKNHPLANSKGAVRYHRHIASLKIGRWLRYNENVHHIDGNRLNNDPDNLMIVDKTTHGLIHSAQERPKERKSKFSKCPYCKKLFKKKRSRYKFCSSDCSNKNKIDNKSLIKFDISREELEKLVWEISIKDIMKNFNIKTKKTIIKKCKKYGIEYPRQNIWNKKKINKAECPTCKNEFNKHHKRQVYCSVQCGKTKGKIYKKKEFTTKEKLQKLVFKKSLKEIASKFGVCEQTVRKRCEEWEIQLPDRNFFKGELEKKRLQEIYDNL